MTYRWRIRVGDYRVIYDVFDGELVVTVVRAAHRREVYGRSPQLLSSPDPVERAARRCVRAAHAPAGALAARDPRVELALPLPLELGQEPLHLVVVVEHVDEGGLAVAVLVAVEAVHRAVAEQRLLDERRHGAVPAGAGFVGEERHPLFTPDEQRFPPEQPERDGARPAVGAAPEVRAEAVPAHQERERVVTKQGERDAMPSRFHVGRRAPTGRRLGDPCGPRAGRPPLPGGGRSGWVRPAR